MPYPDTSRDLSYLTSLPGASERLQNFAADLDRPESFRAAIEGCRGFFHVAYPTDFQDKETEAVTTRRAITGTLGVLRACLDSKTVKRFVYTSSSCTVVYNQKGIAVVMDKTDWIDIDYVRAREFFRSLT
ncbi:unnamed protein product [Thlaspi arvense]|uniref:3-beta hydroxysteroid dehydrogenase/isomerase domain-containing protein n=1 Tax=Thlaspi arvense TaxID=13288 RepID=A0AAU9S2I0_THLAR|nr:unnamed protein product [Thlaspi arvense]